MSHTFDAYADSDAAVDDALAWADNNDARRDVPDQRLVALYLSTPTAADNYQRWCDDLLSDHLERRADERNGR